MPPEGLLHTQDKIVISCDKNDAGKKGEPFYITGAGPSEH
jgi:hypothetical protein